MTGKFGIPSEWLARALVGVLAFLAVIMLDQLRDNTRVLQHIRADVAAAAARQSHVESILMKHLELHAEGKR